MWKILIVFTYTWKHFIYFSFAIHILEDISTKYDNKARNFDDI